jgi:hypothetical protein
VTRPSPYLYATHLDVRFGALKRFDVQAMVDACTDRWYNQTLCRVNESVVRLGVVQGERGESTHSGASELGLASPT